MFKNENNDNNLELIGFDCNLNLFNINLETMKVQAAGDLASMMDASIDLTKTRTYNKVFNWVSYNSQL